ncbi:MAG: hypothetical protein ACLGHN_15990 [Bacteriovoracia bacterium]
MKTKAIGITLLSLSLSFAHAGVSLQIEQQRSPSLAKDIYKIECDEKCALEMKATVTEKGTSESKVYEEKIKELMSMKKSGALPKSNTKGRQLYKIEANDGKNSINLVLAYPLSYKGKEYQKYLKTVSVIEDLKRSMTLDLTESKK